MIIGVDARPLLEPQGGLRRYLDSLLPALYLAADDAEWRLFLTSPLDLPARLMPPRGRVVVVPGPTTTSLRTLWEEWFLPPALSRHRIDVLFSPYGAVPRRASCPVVATIHDLYFRNRPDTMPLRHRVYWNSVAIRAARAERILTPSESTRRDCIALLGLSPDRVVVTSLGVSSAFRLSGDDDPTDPPSSQSVGGTYILTFGPWTRRKNLDALVVATMSLADAAGRPVRLAVTGHSRPGASLDHVVALGELSDPDLAGVMRGATLCCVPSLHEGFGLPVIEAMACGTPVVVSSGGALPEIGGAAALVLPPNDRVGWRTAIERLLHDPLERRRLSVAGLDRSRIYTWEKTALGTYAALAGAARKGTSLG